MAFGSHGGNALRSCPSSYLSPKCEVRKHPAKGGHAVFAVRPFDRGETIAVWSGRLVSPRQLSRLPIRLKQHTVQVEENLYLTSLGADEPPDFINHSCAPNAGLSGQISCVALRMIEPGEEITIDYAMCDGTPYDEFDCECGAPNCRGRITGQDWSRPELWARYAGHFSPYLQRRIDQLTQSGRRGLASVLDAEQIVKVASTVGRRQKRGDVLP